MENNFLRYLYMLTQKTMKQLLLAAAVLLTTLSACGQNNWKEGKTLNHATKADIEAWVNSLK